MTSITRVRNLPASGAFVPVAALSALVGLFLCSIAMFPTPAVADVPGYLGIHWEVVPRTPCPDAAPSIRFSACRCNVEFLGAELAPDGPVVLRARIRPYIVCAACNPDSIDVPLGQHAPGNYVITIRIVADVEDSLGQFHSETQEFPFAFIVSPTCQEYPGKILPYLDEVLIGPRDRGICPNVEIPITLVGQFPDQCVHLIDVHHVPSPIVGPRPEPDVVEIVYGYNSCIDIACPQVITPWKWELGIPGLPPGPYGLIVRTLLQDECHRSLPIPIGQTVLPFAVAADSCDSIPPPPPRECFDARFVQKPNAACDDTFAPGHAAHATYEVASTVPLAGLQGRFEFDLPGLIVQNLELTGAASGMRLFWTRVGSGAQWVLFSDNGSLLPAHPPVWTEPWVPILTVTALPDTDLGTNDRIRLAARDLIASDSLGVGVPGCFQIMRERQMVYLDHDATFCRERVCDTNGDGSSDVRDLVRMVNCIFSAGPCPSDMDCDGNAQVNLDDVVCCARHVLHLDAPSGGGTDARGVAVTFGAPARVAGGCDVTLTVSGMEALAGARLDVAYPSDRYELAGVDLPSAGPGWLNVAEPGDGRVGIALLYAGAIYLPEGSYRQNAVLHLRLKPGQSDGGDVTVAGGQFVGGDGAALRVEAIGLSVPLGGAGQLALSSPLPNPTRAGASFSIAVREAGDLDVGVFDAGGRRIATLFHGTAAAGSRGFTWDGRRGNGLAAGSGLYFVRAEMAGERATQKILILSPR